MARIGIFGGSFNPIHNGHVNSVRNAIAKLAVDKVILIPSNVPPHKEFPEGTPDKMHRYKMVEAAIKEIPEAEVSDIEFKRDGINYTWDTVCELKKVYPDDEIYMLVGTDMFLTLTQWYKAELLLKTVKIVAFRRDDKKILDMAQYLRETYGTDVYLLENDVIEISSTQLRERIADGSGVKYIPKAVYEYIVEHELYGIPQNVFHKMRLEVSKNLSEKRWQHVLGTEEEAVKLAEKWGADENDARMAAIMHDITKELDLSAQLKLCEKYGIMLDNIEIKQKKLLHAKTGAKKAKELFDISEKVYDAIFWHTTGKADMTLLDKVIYLADYIEPGRNFPGVEKIRKLAYENIDEAVLLGLTMTKHELEASGEILYFKSDEAIDWIVRNKK